MAVGADFTFKVTHRGQSLARFKRKVRTLRPKILRKAELIGGRIGDKISMIINRDRVRKGKTSSGGLASVFRDRSMVKVSMIGDIIHVGVGDKRILNTKYPYWKVVNKGGFIPSATFGFFSHGERPNSAYAGTGAGSSLWHRRDWSSGSRGVFFMKPKNPIPAMNYIGKTKTWARRSWRTKWKQEILNTIKKNR